MMRSLPVLAPFICNKGIYLCFALFVYCIAYNNVSYEKQYIHNLTEQENVVLYNF